MEEHCTEVGLQPTVGQLCQRVVESDLLGGVGDLVAREQEAQGDEQTSGGDERDHVAHAGQQDLP